MDKDFTYIIQLLLLLIINFCNAPAQSKNLKLKKQFKQITVWLTLAHHLVKVITRLSCAKTFDLTILGSGIKFQKKVDNDIRKPRIALGACSLTSLIAPPPPYFSIYLQTST